MAGLPSEMPIRHQDPARFAGAKPDPNEGLNLSELNQKVSWKQTFKRYYDLLLQALGLAKPGPLIQSQQVTVIGAGSALGQPIRGVDEAPKQFREKNLIGTLEELGWQVKDAGDIVVDHPQSIQASGVEAPPPAHEGVKNVLQAAKATQEIADATYQVAKNGDFCLTLGGDHSIAIGSLFGLLKAYTDLRIIWVDAHGDMNTPQTSPSGNLHGMPIAALIGAFQLADYPGFEFFKPLLKPERLALVGIRSLDAGERTQIEQSGAHIFTMAEVDRYGIASVMQAAMKAVNPKGTSPMHLSYDIDALDPSIAPATGTKVPGGLTYREAHYIAETLAESGKLVSMDLVEVNPKLANGAQDPTVDLAIGLIESALGKRIYPTPDKEKGKGLGLVRAHSD